MFRIVPVIVLGAFLGAFPATAGNLFVTIPGSDFDGGIRDSIFFAGGGSTRYCENYCEIVASAGLPHASWLLGVEIDACRDSAGDQPINVYVLRRLQNDAAVEGEKVEVLLMSTVTETGCDYSTAAPASPVFIDNFNSEYLILVQIGDLLCGTFGQPPCPDFGTRFQAVRVYYATTAAGGVVEPTVPSSFTVFPEP